MGINYLWDTNIAIYYLQQQLPPKGESFIDTILNESFPVISFITELELLCWKSATEKDIVLLRNFVQDSLVIDIDASIKARVVEIRKSLRVKLPDAIIAATALAHNTHTSYQESKGLCRCQGFSSFESNGFLRA